MPAVQQIFLYQADFHQRYTNKKEIGRQLVTCRLAHTIEPTNGVSKLGRVKALFHQASFLATCLAILFHESLPSIACPEMSMSRNNLLLRQLPKVELGSVSCNGDCIKNIARQVHFRTCYTTLRLVQLVW